MKLTAVAVVILALGIVAGCGGGSSEPTPTATPTAPPTRALNGTMTLDNGFIPSGSDANAKVGRNCRGEGGYDDIQEGTQVTVRDETDAIIGTGRLSQGKLTASGFFGKCRFEFTIRDVPEAGFYTIEVSRRGGLTYSAEELDGLSWMVAFTLGN